MGTKRVLSVLPTQPFPPLAVTQMPCLPADSTRSASLTDVAFCRPSRGRPTGCQTKGGCEIPCVEIPRTSRATAHTINAGLPITLVGETAELVPKDWNTGGNDRLRQSLASPCLFITYVSESMDCFMYKYDRLSSRARERVDSCEAGVKECITQENIPRLSGSAKARHSSYRRFVLAKVVRQLLPIRSDAGGIFAVENVAAEVDRLQERAETSDS